MSSKLIPECHGDCSLGFGEHRPNDLVDQSRTVRQRIGVLGGNGGAQDIVGRNTSALPAQFETAVWPADTFNDAIANQSLQDRLEMPRRAPVPGGECLRRNRASPRVDGNVNYGSNGVEAFARHQRHFLARPTVAPDTSGIMLQPTMRLGANGGGC